MPLQMRQNSRPPLWTPLGSGIPLTQGTQDRYSSIPRSCLSKWPQSVEISKQIRIIYLLTKLSLQEAYERTQSHWERLDALIIRNGSQQHKYLSQEDNLDVPHAKALPTATTKTTIRSPHLNSTNSALLALKESKNQRQSNPIQSQTPQFPTTASPHPAPPSPIHSICRQSYYIPIPHSEPLLTHSISNQSL